jgi:hypothetical protein
MLTLIPEGLGFHPRFGAVCAFCLVAWFVERLASREPSCSVTSRYTDVVLPYADVC